MGNTGLACALDAEPGVLPCACPWTCRCLCQQDGRTCGGLAVWWWPGAKHTGGSRQRVRPGMGLHLRMSVPAATGQCQELTSEERALCPGTQ